MSAIKRSAKAEEVYAVDFRDAGMLFLWVSHDYDCPGTDGKLSQCRCSPITELVTQAEFVHRAEREARNA